MSNATADVIVGKPKVTGGFASSIIDTPVLPTDAATPIAASSFFFHGYVDAEGVTQTIDASDEKIKAWGGSVIKIVRSEHSVSYSLTLKQAATVENLSLVFGADNVTKVGELITVKITSDMVLPRSYVFDMAEKPRAIRIVVPNGQLAYSGDTSFTDGATIDLPITIDALPDSVGANAYLYIEPEAPPATPATTTA